MKQATLYAVIITAILASVGLGQEGVKPAFSPVPLWPKDGNIPEAMKDKNVFLSPQTQEVVVAIGDSTDRRILRFGLHNQAEAIVNSQISKRDGLYVYEYTVSAGNNTRRPLKTWSLLVPADDGQFNTQSPAAWRAEKKATQLVDRNAARHAPLMYVDFSAAAGSSLSKGNSASGFRLVSGYLPGYVSSFARSEVTTELTPEQLEALPKAVADEVRRVIAPEWDSQMGMVIGPRFVPNTPKLMIADSFHFAISKFSIRGLLDKKSEFVVSATQALRSYLQNGRSDPFTSDQLSFLTTAKTPLEREIADAMRLSLLANP